MDVFEKRSSISHQQTRSSQLLEIRFLKPTSGQRSVYLQPVKLWNALSDRLKLCKNVCTFKLALRKKLLEEFLSITYLT